jgi:hypothetical protein
MFLWEQNLILLEILESLDASESSQADFIRDMKESLLEQASLFQMPLESASGQIIHINGPTSNSKS